MPTPTFDGDVYAEDQQYKDDTRLMVQFYVEAVQNQTKTLAEGRPIFDEVPHVKIITPGSRDVMVTRATANYQQRFPKQWARFQANQHQVMDGTPLEQVPFLTIGQVAELKALNVFTLEQLAELPDSVAHKFMGAQKMKQQAAAYLSAAKDAAPLLQMTAELEKRDSEITILKDQVAKLIAAAERTAPRTAKAA